MKLGPLDRVASPAFDRRLILDPEVSFSEEQTRHPLFTEEQARRWIETGVWSRTARFCFKQDGKQTVPDNVYTIWSARLRSVLWSAG